MNRAKNRASVARKAVDQFLANAESDHAAQAPDRIRRAMLNGGATIETLSSECHIGARDVKAHIDAMREAGANIVQRGGLWLIDRYLAPPTESTWTVRGVEGKPFRFGLVADSHLGSKHERLDALHGLYDWFAREKVQTVYHCGNWIEGEARFNRHELQEGAHGMQAQLNYFVEHYPQRPGIETHYVAGDDHEGWYSQREGVDIGRMLASTARAAGRSDLVYLGYKEAFITLEHPRTKRHARLLIDHPGGGSSYAVSYAPQKRIEAAQSGEKPAIWCFGHWHKSGYFVARGVHAILVPCTKDLDTFGRKKGLEYVIGGVLVDAWQDEGGAITRVVPQFQLYFDRGYHNQSYSLSGPVRSTTSTPASKPAAPHASSKRKTRRRDNPVAKPNARREFPRVELP